MVKYDDNTPMPFGEFKGIALINVPAGKLIWYYENLNISESMKVYIKDNWQVLQQQAKTAGRSNAR